MARDIHKNVIVSLDLSTRASAMKLAGIYRYLRGEPRWDITLLSGRSGLTESLVRRHIDHADGFILMVYPSPAAIMRLATEHKPIVTIDFSYPVLSANGGLVRIDPNAIVEAAAAHFDTWGRFATYAYIHDKTKSIWSKARAYAAAQTLARRNRKLIRIESNRLHAKNIEQLPKPAAILTADDATALQVVNLCNRHKIRVPEDVSILGIDNDERYVMGSTPSISSIEPEFEREGFEAARMLDELMSRESHSKRRLVRCGINAIFQRGSTGKRPPSEALVERAENYIRANFGQLKGPADIAAAIGVSRRLLDLRMHELHRPSLAEQLRSVRLQRLSELLKSTQLPVTHLAHQVGFGNLAWAMTVFRKHFGQSMKGYRNAHRRQGTTHLSHGSE